MMTGISTTWSRFYRLIYFCATLVPISIEGKATKRTPTHVSCHLLWEDVGLEGFKLEYIVVELGVRAIGSKHFC